MHPVHELGPLPADTPQLRGGAFGGGGEAPDPVLHHRTFGVIARAPGDHDRVCASI